MIELDRHIEILLLSNDCVIVPDLGGFMTHHVDASYCKDDNTFLPPMRTLGFNPQLKMNDSLLVQSYIEAYDISYPEALRRIETEVSELRQHLETEGEYELNDIGVLRLNDEGHLEFDPCEAGILTPSLYGLSAFEMRPLTKVVPLVQENTDDETDVDELPGEHGITIKIKWIRNVVAVAAAVIGFLMIGTPVSNSRYTSSVQQSSFLPVSTNTQQRSDSATANTIMETTDEAEPDGTDNQTETNGQADVNTQQQAELTVEPETTAAAQQEGNYTIVLASQVSEKGANNFVSLLEREGFNEATVTINQNHVRRVVYGSYASETDAHNAIRNLRAQSKHFREAWVMKK